ncbi:MAG: putative hydrolase of the superfamily [Gaiellaceae bacterium]|nr:putative hydrolase of the superfamily [Gaiellaceae bacterium]
MTVPVRAVVFDLWNTIAEWPDEEWARVRPRVAERLGLTPQEFDERWYGELARMREMGPFADVLAHFDVTPEAAEEVVELRRAVTRQGLVPVPGAAETIAALRDRGFLIGLITVCSEDVALLWEETAFHGLFDVEVFSATAGLRKPDPRIYRLALEQLGVEPGEAVFVGDGANDELAGAERVGMTAIGVDSPGGELGDWDGLRIRALPELLELLEGGVVKRDAVAPEGAAGPEQRGS